MTRARSYPRGSRCADVKARLDGSSRGEGRKPCGYYEGENEVLKCSMRRSALDAWAFDRIPA